MKCVLILVIGMGTAVSFADTPPRLQSLKESFEREVQRTIAPLDQKYVVALNGLQRDYSKSGNLNAALIIKDEIDRVRNSEPEQAAKEGDQSNSTTTPELTKLKNSYGKAVERKALPIITRYKEELAKLQEKLTAANDLESAVVVRDRLKQVDGDAVAATVARATAGGSALGNSTPLKKVSPLADWLQDHEFTWKGNTAEVVIQFNGDKAHVSANGTEIMQKSFEIKEDNVIEFEWSTGDRNTFTLDKNRNTFSRHMQKGDSSMQGTVRNR